MAKLKAPAGCSSCSFEGESYQVKKGYVNVPTEAVSALVSHGFVSVEDEEAMAADAIAIAEKAAAITSAEQSIVSAQAALDAEQDEAVKVGLAQAVQDAIAALEALKAE